MKPDLVWNKRRDVGYSHRLWDSSRGVTKYMASDSTDAEATFGYVSSFNTDGITFGNNDQSVNVSGGSYVLWNWKANGGTKGTNSAGSTNATVQVNQDAGFSIVEFTTDGGNETYGHGLGVKPDIVIVKSRSAGGFWLVSTNVIDGSVDYLNMTGTAAAADLPYGAFTSSTFQYNDNNGITQIAYCFAEKQGYSKFGKYVGNSSTDGPFVYTGFKPAFVLQKQTSGSGNGWFITDSKRDPFNAATMKYLRADENGSEGTTTKILDLLSNGFKLRNNDSALNGSGHTYIYMAFAENPFVTSTGVPACAR